MPIIHIALVLLLSAFQASAYAGSLSAEDRGAVLATVDSVRLASLREDLDEIADKTFAPLMDLFGGRTAFIDAGKQIFTSAKAMGITYLSSESLEPSELLDAGKYEVSVVPAIHVFQIKGVTIRDTTFDIAVREKGNPEWRLIGGPGLRKAPQVLKLLLPDFPSSYALPKNTQERLP